MTDSPLTPLIRTEKLDVVLGGVPILTGIDFDILPGEVHAITGENGAGKSTLAKVIAGIYQPAGGSLFLDGQMISIKSPGDAIHRGIALIHQEPLIFPDLDVASNIFVGRLPKKGPIADHAEAARRTNEILTELGANFDAKAEVGRLSIAQQQMVELATAMSEDARVWIFDETTASLTPKEVAELFKIIRRLKEKGCAIAIVTHHLNQVFEIADRITVLRDGRKVAEKQTAEVDHRQLVNLMVGRDISHERMPRSNQPLPDPYLVLQDLTGPGYHNVSLNVRRTEIVGIAGLVGAGRTEVARSLFGITHATDGAILVDGQTVRVANPCHAQSIGFALVPEDRQKHALFPDLSIQFNTSANILRESSKAGWINSKATKSKSLAILESFRTVFKHLEQPIRQLSGGNQQKTIIGRWLLAEPDFLILDEPTRGVDVGARREVHQFLRDQAESGKAVLVISSDLPELLTLTDRIYVMRQGTIVGEVQTESATEESLMALAFGGSA
ncbi:MAG: sugar ABC transporter ATP-binding protein [Armatimonadetes bacterium]|nr:sugar ABC transporter ATP-binding protein [Armatimonadota bacterium]